MARHYLSDVPSKSGSKWLYPLPSLPGVAGVRGDSKLVIRGLRYRVDRPG